MKTSHLFVSSLLTIALLTGCNVKLEGKSDPANNGLNTPTSILDGTWKTGCISQNSYYFKGQVKISGTTYQSVSSVFSDSNCATALFPAQSSEGTYTLTSRSDGLYNITMYSDLGNGASQIFNDILKLESGRFYMGDASTAAGADNRPTVLDMNKPYIKQ